ncbi:MAG: hypothetical protein VXX03_02460 [Candidatus Thermoplasmatota archaeon]|nr:hypothetical protein [Poseidonia sp.]MEC7090153.1 hypothetical protein [Candidatus Thermoplasmatota archaeon]MEC7110978.1 hypothetical protein [Candidatus Thermoplasmatota archaeon]MEC7600935.1 hypothetical protein [Candidatus Thermoplasmatota archaeon]MEC8708422.1 hypothetical protein [Candidatus Thermoplasmatota archaeon]
MSAASILASALLAGVVATAVTVAIEKWGGLVGGLLGTVPSTIVPAAVGIHLAGGDEALLASMAIVPLGMLLNALFLGAWLVLPRWFSHASRPLLWTSLGSLAIWGLLGAIVLTLVGGLLSPNLSDRALALVGFVPLFITAVAFNRRPSLTPKGSNPVSKSVLVARGTMAATAIGVAVWLAGLGHPLLAGLASVFPAIFLTSMVALWLAQGPSVPQGAAGPMMLGGASVAVYANVAMWSLPAYGAIVGSLLAWVVSVLGWSVPAYLVLRRVHVDVNG